MSQKDSVQFRALTDTEYRDFLRHQDRVYYTQLLEYGDAIAPELAKVERVGMIVDGRIVGAASVTYQPWKRFFKRAFVLFGPSLDYSKPRLAESFMRNLIKWVRRDRSVLALRVNPYVIRRPYEDTTPGAQLEIADQVDAEMAACGGVKVQGEFYEDTSIQNRFTYSKDLQGMTHQQAIASSGNNVRAGVRKAASLGVRVEYLGAEDFGVLQPIFNHTAERTGMPPITPARVERNRRMFEAMESGEFLVPAAVLYPEQAVASIDAELEESAPRLVALQEKADEAAAEGKGLPKKQKNQLAELERRRDSLLKNRQQTLEAQEKYGDRVILAASFFVETPTDMVFHHSGGYSDLAHYRGIYAIHDAMIERAVERGLRWYNLNVISGQFEEGGHSYGVFDYKRNFRGVVEELVGSYDFALSPLARPLRAVEGR